MKKPSFSLLSELARFSPLCASVAICRGVKGPFHTGCACRCVRASLPRRGCRAHRAAQGHSARRTRCDPPNTTVAQDELCSAERQRDSKSHSLRGAKCFHHQPFIIEAASSLIFPTDPVRRKPHQSFVFSVVLIISETVPERQSGLQPLELALFPSKVLWFKCIYELKRVFIQETCFV